MFGSPIIEVLIGIVFVYSLFSILVTQINTLISNGLKLRANHLYDGIEDLITDPVLRAKIIVHPLIRFAQDRQYLPPMIDEQTAKVVLDSGIENVQYINTETFVEVLLDVVTADEPAVLNELFSRMRNILAAMPEGHERDAVRNAMNNVIMTGTGVETLRTLILELDEPAYRHALNDALEDLEEDMVRFGLPLEGNVRLLAGLRSIDSPYMRATLETLLMGAHSLENAQKRIGTWFDARMDQATEAFSSRMGFYSIVVGFLISITLNVDTLYLMQTLWNDPALRQTLSIAAENTDLEQALAVINEAATSAEGDTTNFEELTANLTALNETADRIATLRLPIGWSLQDLSNVADASLLNDRRYLWNFVPGNNDQWLYFWGLKALGILATTIAIAQGAPFWFNILRRISNGK